MISLIVLTCIVQYIVMCLEVYVASANSKTQRLIIYKLSPDVLFPCNIYRTVYPLIIENKTQNYPTERAKGQDEAGIL